MPGDDTIEAAIEEMLAALTPFVHGDAAPYAALWSHGADVTIYGGYGAYEQGWAAVSARLAWAASRFAGGHVTYEPLAAGSSGELGYAIGLERGAVGVVGAEAPGLLVLRVTHVFRREAGQWKLIHRHADPIAAKTPPEAILRG